jgi:hypothetical protein
MIEPRCLTGDRLASVCFRTASRELENGFVGYHGQPKRHSEMDRQERSRAQEFAAVEAWCSRGRPRMPGPVLPRSDVMKSRRRRFPRRRELVPRKAKSTEVPCYEGMTSSIAPSPSDLLTRSFRAMDSIIGQFCLKNVVASWILGACTLTLQACLPPPFVI